MEKNAIPAACSRPVTAVAGAENATRYFCVANPGKIEIVRFVLFDSRTKATYEAAIAEILGKNE